MASRKDLDLIWKWNANVPERIATCVHHIFEEVVHEQPQATAICAWDGQVTYRELDELSTRLASTLLELGIGPGDLVALCFGKSLWHSVARLGVMKAGGASVVLSISQPRDRLQMLVKQSRAKVILCSSQAQSLADQLAEDDVPVLVVSRSTTNQQAKQTGLTNHGELSASCTPSDLLYMHFTSGSTGVPKAVLISHGNIASAFHHQLQFYGFGKSQRVLDFALYAYDVTWMNFLFTLASGACLCVPTDDEMQNDLSSCLLKYRVTWMDIIPSLVPTIETTALAGLQHLMLGGEPVTAVDLERLNSRTRVTIAYGPAECTPISTGIVIKTRHIASAPIGHGNGACTWVVEPELGQSLMPIGAIGELWLEGPIVGQGYFHDNDRTAAAFVIEPKWLTQPSSSGHGRRGTLYRTGDLVKYNRDGSLVFVGRKDAQVKIRGQRLELGEIELYLNQYLPDEHRRAIRVVVEAVTPLDSANALLVAFLTPHNIPNGECKQIAETSRQLASDLDQRLLTKLPMYMIPSVYLYEDHVPIVASGKIDRRGLRLRIQQLTTTELSTRSLLSSTKYRMPDTPIEIRLQGLWSTVLNVDVASISANDSFFRIGGDSLQAMRLVGTAREQDIHFTVQDVFRHPKLYQLAEVAGSAKPALPAEIEPQQPLLPDNENSNEHAIRTAAAAVCGVDACQVQDVFPCTPLQEGLIALTTKTAGDYIFHSRHQLKGDIQLDRFKAACNTMFQNVAILRTRIVDIPGTGIVQVVIDEDSFCDEYSTEREPPEMALGQKLAYCYIVTDTSTGGSTFHWILHHALYDGWSFSIMLDALESAYANNLTPQSVPFQDFVKHVVSQQKSLSSLEFWRAYLDDIDGTVFPPINSNHQSLSANSSIEHRIADLEQPKNEITMTTVIRAAWAILQASHTMTDDVTYGAIVNGRQAPVPGVDKMMGPTMATVPVRVKINWEESVGVLLRRTQQEALTMMPFEQVGLSTIRKLGPDASRACDFQCLLNIQLAAQSSLEMGMHGPFVDGTDVVGQTDPGKFGAYGLTIDCSLEKDAVTVEVSYSPGIVQQASAQQYVRQLEIIIRQICSSNIDSIQLKDLTLCSEEDLRIILNQNNGPPSQASVFVHDMISKVCDEQPESLAVQAWDGDLTYGQLNDLSTRLANKLVTLGIVRNDIVPLWFEKSKWLSVALLAVMKAGGASLTVDVSQPEVRLSAIARQVTPTVVLSSGSKASSVPRLYAENIPVIVVDQNLFDQELKSNNDAEQLTQFYNAIENHVMPDDLLYVIFTSGTTGVPKGIMISHVNAATMILCYKKSLGMTKDDRIIDFSSSASDVFWHNYLFGLTTGACICVPNDSQRNDNLASFINEQEITYADLTPSVVRLLHGVSLPKLETLVLGGETVPAEELAVWKHLNRRVVSYGPAECTINATMSILGKGETLRTGVLGKTIGHCSWVIDPRKQTICPPECVGELWLEGPLLGKGYLNNSEKTDASFVCNPQWWLDSILRHGRIPGECRRFYKTGDLVRRSVDGVLQFVGRCDAQVKIRGQRVELEEVERHISHLLPDGFHSVVDVVTSRNSKVAVLVAFIVSPATSTAETTQRRSLLMAEISEQADKHLGTHLPQYMIPSAYVPIESIPMTVNGKINRPKLRLIAETTDLAKFATPSQGTKSPSSAVETQLAAVWADVLNIPGKNVQVDVPFTRLGGDSISAMQVVSRCRAQGLVTTVTDVLQLRTIEALASKCRLLQAPKTVTDDTQLSASWPVSPIQRLFFLGHPDGLAHFNQSFLLQLQAGISISKLEKAARSLVSRHPMLRARFQRNNGGAWEQYIAKNDQNAFLFVRHRVSDDDQMSQAVRYRQSMLDIRTGPVFAIDVFEYEAGSDVQVKVLFLAHHAVVDFVSWRVIWQDIEDQLQSEAVLPPPTSTSFRSWCHILTQRAGKVSPSAALPFVFQNRFDYWGVEPSANVAGAVFRRIVALDETTTSLLLKECNESMRTEPIDIMVAVLMHSFHQTFSQIPVPAISIESHGRHDIDSAGDIDLSETIGWFTLIHPLQVSFRPQCSILDVVKLIKDQRRKVPNKGLDYFATHFGPDSQQFEDHANCEIVLNYAGIFQQLEKTKSVFTKAEHGDFVDVSAELRRVGLIEIEGVVEDGKLELNISVHKGMKHQKSLNQWISGLKLHFEQSVQAMVTASHTLTLTDVPLLSVTHESLDKLVHRLQSLDIDCDNIAGIYPCTPLQKGILLSVSKGEATYQTVEIWECSDTLHHKRIVVEDLEKAWREALSRHSIFQTRFVEVYDLVEGFVQVQMKNVDCPIRRLSAGSGSPTTMLRMQRGINFEGSQLAYLVTICEADDGSVACKFEISHALIDAMSVNVLLSDVVKAYETRQSLVPAMSFGKVIEHIMNDSYTSKLEYWRQQLEGCNPTCLPRSVPEASNSAPGKHTMRQSIKSLSITGMTTGSINHFCQVHDLTRPVFLQVTWALTLSHVLTFQDVCFGYAASGRDITLSGLEEVVGPLMAMLIARVDLNLPALQVLKATGEQAVQHLANQHVSLPEIQRDLGLYDQQLYNTSMTVQVKPPQEEAKSALRFDSAFIEDPNEFHMTLDAELDGDKTNVTLHYRTDLVAEPSARQIAAVFELAVTFLTQPSHDSNEDQALCEAFSEFCLSQRDFPLAVPRIRSAGP